jgi:glycerophosphoryl diester phosphodiesterase
MRIIQLALFALTFAFLPSSFGKSPKPTATHRASIEVHGHRGARARLPEDTLPAFEYALKVGVDFLEMDLAVTRDGVLVISHDPHVNAEICLSPSGEKITQPPLIHHLSLAELKRYDCGSIRHPRFAEQTPVPGTRIPTLDEVFEFIKKSPLPHAKTVRFNIETKIFADHPEYTVGPEEFTELALKAFERHGMTQRIVLQSFDPRTLILARKQKPALIRSILVEDPKKDLVEAGKKTTAQIVSPNWELLTPKNVQKLHKNGFKVHPWTPNSVEAWTQLIQMGVDGIITDDPEGLKKFLETH